MFQDPVFYGAFLLVALPGFGSNPSVARYLARSQKIRNLKVIFGALGIVGFLLNRAIGLSVNYALLLFILVYQASLVRFLYLRFIEKNGREPVDAAFNFSPLPLQDRVFAFQVVFLGYLIAAGVLLWFNLPGGAT